DDDMTEFEQLAENMDLEELVTQLRDENSDEVDDLDDLIDELEQMGEEEQKEVEKRLTPVKVVLVKLRKIAFKIINSPTLLLPAWKSVLQELDEVEKLMPRDVSTRWNSTYNMCSFAEEYRQPIDQMT
ncbi:hypothetical protein K435DRAFT_632528, partial [Dendrothele bispora CBS 962.96]